MLDVDVSDNTVWYPYFGSEHNLFSKDTINLGVRFLLNDKDRLKKSGSSFFDIVSVMDHEYKHYIAFLGLRSALNNGANVDNLLKARNSDASERSAIEFQRSKPYYIHTSQTQKNADNDYYKANGGK